MKAYEQQLEWDGVPATTRNALLRVVSALLLGGALTPEAVPLLLGTRLAGGWKAVEVSS